MPRSRALISYRGNSFGKLAHTIHRHNTAAFFAERRDRADLAAFRRLVTRPGGQPPQAGDEREID
jgi:hypothetical protein